MKLNAAALAMLAATLVPLGAGAAPTQHAVRALASPVPASIAPPPAPSQPLPYSHKLHVGLGLACALCHTAPAPGAHMTFPATATCMGCHSAVAVDKPAIRKLAEYANSGESIPWVRVYQVLPGVTWTHRPHLEARVPCEACHGAVAAFETTSQLTAVTGMASCIGCHEARRVSADCATCHAWPGKP
jgi:hypothetical protein